MLMTVLKGEQATAQSKALIRLFKQMKDYIAAENAPDVELGDIHATGNKITTIMQLEDIAVYRPLFERLLREGE